MTATDSTGTTEGTGPDPVQALAYRVGALERNLEQISVVIETAAEQVAEAALPEVPGTHPDAARPEDNKAEPEGDSKVQTLDLRALDVWVQTWFLPTFRRTSDAANHRWCEKWWAHAEAVLRLEATRTAFLAMTAEGGAGVATWLREVLDIQLAHLTSDEGPFRQCKQAPTAKHTQLPVLPAIPIPGELLEEIDAGQPAAAILADPTVTA